MIKKLLVVFASGLVLATVFGALTWVVGGAAITRSLDHHHVFFNDDDDSDRGAQTTRSFAFDPNHALDVSVTGELQYTRGDTPSMIVRGPSRAVAALRFDNGRLSQDGTSWLAHDHGVKIEIVAPQMPALTYSGAGDITLDGLQQDRLDLTLSGAGSVDANGHVSTVSVDSSGAGSVDLEKLMAHDANVTVGGVGSVDLSADGKVAVTISGAGSVSLHRKPSQLTSQISGVGSIDDDY